MSTREHRYPTDPSQGFSASNTHGSKSEFTHRSTHDMLYQSLGNPQIDLCSALVPDILRVSNGENTTDW
jgi:hypothetical protein